MFGSKKHEGKYKRKKIEEKEKKRKSEVKKREKYLKSINYLYIMF